MGQNHARIYSELGCLAGVHDALPGAGRGVAKRLGTNDYETVDELLQDVDAVSVCTPTPTRPVARTRSGRVSRSMIGRSAGRVASSA